MSSVSQRKMRQLRCESLEDRCCLSAESVGWDGPGQGSATLTYHLSNVPSYLDEATVDQALSTAMSAWSDVIDVDFVKTDRANLANSIDISFTPLDGAGGTLAQAYFPDDVNSARLAGDIQFDSSERWEVGNTQGSRAFDLVLVAVHELGHSLGLEHAHGASAVMAASVSAVASFTRLAADDIDAALSLYAAAPSSTTPSGTLLPPLTTSLAGGTPAATPPTSTGTSTRTPTATNPPTTTPTLTPPTTNNTTTPTGTQSPGTRLQPGWEITLWTTGHSGRWFSTNWSYFTGTVPMSSSTWLTNLTTRLHSSWRSWWV